MKITGWNRGGAPGVLHMIPQLVLGNTWRWEPGSVRPRLRAIDGGAVAIAPAALGVSRLYFDGDADLLFTENESNPQRLWNIGGPGYYKDGFHERIVGGHIDRVNPSRTGTKARVWFQSTIVGGGKQEDRLRLSRRGHAPPLPRIGGGLQVAGARSR